MSLCQLMHAFQFVKSAFIASNSLVSLTPHTQIKLRFSMWRISIICIVLILDRKCKGFIFNTRGKDQELLSNSIDYDYEGTIEIESNDLIEPEPALMKKTDDEFDDKVKSSLLTIQ